MVVTIQINAKLTAILKGRGQQNHLEHYHQKLSFTPKLFYLHLKTKN